MDTKPLIIGICGNSGCGKTLFAEKLAQTLGEKDTVIINGDDYHKWQRGAKEWDKYTHLNPEANNLSLEAEHLKDLKKGNSIYKVHYDHDAGVFTNPQHIIPKKYIIFEGLHTFFTNELRQSLDLKIFIDVKEDLNIHFKTHRDMRERGYSKEKVLISIQKRIEDSKKFIFIQKKFADLIIQKSPLIKLTDKKEDTAVEFSFIQKKKINIKPIYDLFSKFFENKIHLLNKNGRQTLVTKKILSHEKLKDLKKDIKKRLNLNISDDIYSLCQLITLYNLKPML